jgi:hypothetical protein
MFDNPWVIVLITVVVLIALRFLLIFLLSGGDVGRIKVSFQAGMRILRDRAFADKVEALLVPPPPPPPPKPSGAPLRLLALLQREGQLVDFLLEDIQAYDNEQIGAAVREIHRKAHHALKEHLILEPVISSAEGETVEVPPGFDPSAVQLLGNVTGQPPFRGALMHPGWRVKEIKLAPPPEGQDEFVLQPAKVELP